MISTKGLVSTVSEIPTTWALEYYCNLTEKLTGQSVKIKSLFNSKDTNPSFVIYYKNGEYRWKDFSTDKGGNFIDLVISLFGLNYFDACMKIVKDYNNFISKHKDGYTLKELKNETYTLNVYQTRSWNTLDANYWLAFGIDSNTLNYFNVRPLSSFTLSTENNTKEPVTITNNFIYGYFNANNEVYKIYQPKYLNCKFLKFRNYIQGTDQLKFEHPNLIICSSLKDAMCLYKFGYNLELVAPDSENTLIRKEVIDLYKKKYKSICTLLDNDTAGERSMYKYYEEYKIPSVHLNLMKDLSDSVKELGLEKVREVLTPLLKEALKK